MQWRNQSHRPKAVTLISILQIIACIGYIILGVMLTLQILSVVLYSANSSIILFSLQALTSYAFLALIFALAILSAVAGRGLYIGKGWSWKYIVILQIIGIPINILSLIIYANLPGPQTFAFASIPGIIVNILTLSYMLKPRTRA